MTMFDGTGPRTGRSQDATPSLPTFGERLYEIDEAYVAARRVLSTLPEHDVTVDGVPVHVRGTVSSDTPLVFVHGWCCSGEVWANQAAEWGSDALFLDLPGHGQSGFDARERLLDRFAESIVAALDRSGAASAVVVGHSMGGWAGALAADRFPDRIRGLVVVDQSLRPPPANRDLYNHLVPLLEGPTSDEVMAGMIEMTLGNQMPRTAREDVRFRMSITQRDVRAAAFADALLLTEQNRWPKSGFDLPVVSIHGARSFLADPNVPLGLGEHYDRYLTSVAPFSMLQHVDDACHFVMLDQPRAFNQALRRAREFIARAV